MQFLVSLFMKKHLTFDSVFKTDIAYILLTQIAACGLPILLVCLFKKGGLKKVFKIAPITSANAVLCVLLGAAAQPVAIVLNMPLLRLASRFGKGGVNVITSPPSDVRELLFLVFVLCAVPAVFEELLLRGVVLRSVEKYGVLRSIAVTAFLFALLHNDFSSFFGHLFLGILLAYAALSTGSVLAAVIVHFSFNAFGLVLDYFIGLYTELSSLGFFVISAGVGAVILVFSVFSLYDCKRITELTENSVYTPFVSFVNIPVLFIFAGYIFKNFVY